MLPHFYLVSKNGKEAYVNVNHISSIEWSEMNDKDCLIIKMVNGEVFRVMKKKLADPSDVLTDIETTVEDNLDSNGHVAHYNAYTMRGSVATYEQNEISVLTNT